MLLGNNTEERKKKHFLRYLAYEPIMLEEIQVEFSRSSQDLLKAKLPESLAIMIE